VSDWTGSGSAVTPPGALACASYASVADVRAAYGDDVADMSDAVILRRLDGLAAEMETHLGHTFGRAAVVQSTAADSLVVATTGVTLAGDAYLFSDHVTLGALAAAINGAGQAYSMDLLPQIDPSTPSNLLRPTSASIGPNYENRAVLCLSGLYVTATGDRTAFLFLPLPLASVTAVMENGLSLASNAYWALVGQTWLVRKCCACGAAADCRHARGRWSAAYPGNVAVTYVPQNWNRPPAALRSMVVEAFGLQAGVGEGGLESESFGGAYSYRRRSGAVQGTWQDALSGATVRQFAIRAAGVP